MSNIYNLFKFLEKKKGTKTPIEIKFIYAPDELTEEDLNVKGEFDVSYTKITSLPDNLKIEYSFYGFNTIFTSLPDNLKVGEDVYLPGGKIYSIPNNLQVPGELDLDDIPLAEKYTEKQIRKMIEDKGGYVKGKIHADYGFHNPQ